MTDVIAENGYVYTGVAATADQETRMQRPTPYIIVGSRLPPAPQELIHAYALSHGLPEIVGFYGYDFGRHEFIRMPGATQGEPDKWPSHKLSDVLAAVGLDEFGAAKP